MRLLIAATYIVSVALVLVYIVRMERDVALRGRTASPAMWARNLAFWKRRASDAANDREFIYGVMRGADRKAVLPQESQRGLRLTERNATAPHTNTLRYRQG